MCICITILFIFIHFMQIFTACTQNWFLSWRTFLFHKYAYEVLLWSSWASGKPSVFTGFLFYPERSLSLSLSSSSSSSFLFSLLFFILCLFFSLFLLPQVLLCNTEEPRTYYVSQAGLKLMIFLSLQSSAGTLHVHCIGAILSVR